MDEKKRQTFLHRLYLAWLFVANIDYADCSAIYLFNYLRAKAPSINPNVLRLITRNILFPITATASVLYATFAWLNAHFDRDRGKMKQEHVIRAVYNTLTAANSVTAMILGIALGASAGSFTFLLYGCNLLLGTIYNIVTVGYHRYKAYRLRKEIEKKGANKENITKLQLMEEAIAKRKGKTLGPMIIGFTSAAMAIAGFVAGTLGIIEFSFLGILAGTIGILFISYEIYKTIKQQKIKDAEDAATTQSLKTSSDALLRKKMAMVAIPSLTPSKALRLCHAGASRYLSLPRKEVAIEMKEDGCRPKPA